MLKASCQDNQKVAGGFLPDVLKSDKDGRHGHDGQNVVVDGKAKYYLANDGHSRHGGVIRAHNGH